MSKELTEQFFKAKLKTGTYYVLDDDGNVDIDYYGGDNFQWTVVKEVLAPVPDYDKFLEYYTGNIHWKKECKRLQEQLEEANDHISQLEKKVKWFEESEDSFKKIAEAWRQRYLTLESAYMLLEEKK